MDKEKMNVSPDADCEHEETRRDFGWALLWMKRGQKVCRRGWNGKGMFLFLADEITFHAQTDLSGFEYLHPKGGLTLPAIVMKTADDHFCVGWLASQADLLAEDWEVFRP